MSDPSRVSLRLEPANDFGLLSSRAYSSVVVGSVGWLMTRILPVDPHRLPAPGGPYREPLTVGGLSGVPDQGAAARCSLD